MSFKFQIYDAVTGKPEGVPYRYIGRCLMRVIEMNIFERANRFSLRPVRVREQIEQTDACLKFKLDLSLATSIDPKQYTKWVNANAVKLAHGFDKSYESDMCVYGRMQFVRATGKGV